MHDWGDVAHFLAAARFGSFVKAAQYLRVDQTTVARRVESLEKLFGVHLFDRTPQGLRVTPAGERALELAELAEVQHFALESSLSGEDQTLEGTVRIAAADGFMNDFLLPRLHEFHLEHPRIILSLVTGHESSDLLRRQADFAIRLGRRPEQNSLKIKKLGSLHWGIYGSREYLEKFYLSSSLDSQIRLEANQDYSWIGLDEERARLPAVKWADKIMTGSKIVMTCTSFPTQLEACKNGFGLTMLPCIMGSRDKNLVRLVPDEAAPESNIWLVVTEAMAESARVRAVMEFVAKTVKNYSAVLRGEPSMACRQ